MPADERGAGADSPHHDAAAAVEAVFFASGAGEFGEKVSLSVAAAGTLGLYAGEEEAWTVEDVAVLVMLVDFLCCEREFVCEELLAGEHFGQLFVRIEGWIERNCRNFCYFGDLGAIWVLNEEPFLGFELQTNLPFLFICGILDIFGSFEFYLRLFHFICESKPFICDFPNIFATLPLGSLPREMPRPPLISNFPDISNFSLLLATFPIY
nr:hypothetical protein [Bacillus infantis]